mmetsp:Transcript_19087/g.39268  ORF Transcript_19087/g.39268 Transcript_19087/m.39268 type:complete len:282 (-) Transcript_19087:140-985(-)
MVTHHLFVITAIRIMIRTTQTFGLVGTVMTRFVVGLIPWASSRAGTGAGFSGARFGGRGRAPNIDSSGRCRSQHDCPTIPNVCRVEHGIVGTIAMTGAPAGRANEGFLGYVGVVVSIRVVWIVSPPRFFGFVSTIAAVVIVFFSLGFGDFRFQPRGVVVYPIVCSCQRRGRGNCAQRTGALQRAVFVVIDSSPPRCVFVLRRVMATVSPVSRQATPIVKFAVISVVLPLRRRRNACPFQSLNAHNGQSAGAAVPSTIRLTGCLVGGNWIDGIDPSLIDRQE